MTGESLEAVFSRLPPRISGIRSERIELCESFDDMVRRFAHLAGTVALVSGGTLDCARFNILGLDPWLTVRTTATETELIFAAGSVTVSIDPFTALERLLERYAVSLQRTCLLQAGLLGYLSYDLKDCLEVLPQQSREDLHLPHLYMTAPRVLVVQDRVSGETTLHLPILEGTEDANDARLAAFTRALTAPCVSHRATMTTGPLVSGFSRDTYVAAVEKIREYIAQGDVYQVNMSQRFETTFSGDAYELFSTLYKRNPAPFFAFINAGDHQIVSTSPERFLLLSGKYVETRPIKGTRPRSSDPERDLRCKQELQSSSKDDAELSMIVDLLRNDIGKVCCAGSVRVSEHKRLESYHNVHHLISIVRGKLDEGLNAVDLLRATFPGGSITGCPKIRSMEIIDELEPVRRHIYTGSIGYMSFHETMDLSIAIRTATVFQEKLYFSVGGGVVFDSDPDDEFDETLHKGQTLIHALGPAGSVPPPTYKPSADAQRD